MTKPSQLNRFIRGVHRRMVLLRAAERLGLCLLGGCVVLLILMPLLLWRGQEMGHFTLITLAIALFGGLLWGLTSRPTPLAAAMEADRQLHLADLLGSALLLQKLAGPNEIEKTILFQAEARCRDASPSSVVLHRLGRRGWGGIGLAVALVAGLFLAGPDTSRSRAQASAGPKSWQEIELENDKSNTTHYMPAPDMRRVKEGNGTDDTDPPPSNTSDADPTSSAAATANSGSQADPGGGQDGVGPGAGQSASKSNTQTPADPSITGGSNPGKSGHETAGGGGLSTENGNSAGKTGNSAASSKSHKPAPIWRSQTWASDQDSARSAIRSGAIPDAYRDLVRDYFERE